MSMAGPGNPCNVKKFDQKYPLVVLNANKICAFKTMHIMRDHVNKELVINNTKHTPHTFDVHNMR